VPWFASIAFVLHGLRSAPKQVAVDGRPVRDFTYEANGGILSVVVPYAKNGQTVTVTY
jgi:hypothetical protein